MMCRFLDSLRWRWAIVASCVPLGVVDLPLHGASSDAAAAQSAPIGPSRTPNHLLGEKSPYLRQHAYNPVDWYPWGNEAFAKARRENKPIFLSIGYSTCHWCQVMARESFENEDIARLMNASFVCIKVDREERPDLDQVYLAFVESTTGNGGWPMTVLLTPDLKPFFGGGYFSPEDGQGRPGLRSILKRFALAWTGDRGGIVAESNGILDELRKQALAASQSEKIGDSMVDDGYGQIARNFDSRFGGFGGAPKFPRPSVLAFLFQVYASAPGSERGRHARDMALFTLRKMAVGGIHDAIGGGFHRYAVDASWQVPHFEKMLYDQAQLAEAYLSAYQITHEAVYAQTARDILDFVRRDMTASEGGFFSAIGADSPVSAGSEVQGEGAFYTWTKGEIDRVVGRERAALLDDHYGVEAQGNVHGDPQGEFHLKNILVQRHSLSETARRAGLGEADAERSLGESRRLLYEARSARPRPNLDDKIVASWNGLMISAYARAYQVLNDPAYLESARRAAAFVETKMYSADKGVLLRSYCGGASGAAGFADDYAFMVQGLLDLYEASFDAHPLEWAQSLQKQQDLLFWDSVLNGYFATSGLDPTVLVRAKPTFDGAEPSANSVASLNLLRLGALFDDPSYRGRGEKTIGAFADQIHRSPSSLSGMLVDIDWLEHTPKQIVIEGREGAADTVALFTELRAHFIPRKTVVLADGGPAQRFLAQRVEFFRDLPATPPAAAKAFVCENYVCHLPSESVATFARLLEPVVD